MSHDVNRERLDRLREDLAALRARTTAEFGLPVATPSPPAVLPGGHGPDRHGPDHHGPDHDGADAGGADRGADAHRPAAERPGDRADDGPVMFVDTASARSRRRGASEQARRPSRPRRRAKPPRPPRRFGRPRARRPAPHKVVPVPIEVRRRPPYVAAPRWPQWGLISATAVLAVVLPAVWQLSYRLLQAMLDTSVLLGADPSRGDFLHAAAGVAGGGLTLSLAVAAIAVVKGKAGYLSAAVGVLTFFCVFPYLAYTANAGIVSAPLPPVETMIRPPRWAYHGQLTAVFWLTAVALAVALLDLAYRSVEALARTVRARPRPSRVGPQRRANQTGSAEAPPTRSATLGTSRTGTDQHH